MLTMKINSLLQKLTYSYIGLLLSFFLYFVQRIRIEEIRNDEWFKKNYDPVKVMEYEDVNLDDINAAFDDTEVSKI